MFSRPVPTRGEIFQIRAYGYYSDESYALEAEYFAEGLVYFDAYLFVVVFRHDAESGLYQLIHGPVELVHGVTVGTLAVQWPVQSGDLVGALIPNSCKNRTTPGIFGCPAYIDTRTDPWNCSSAIYYPFDADMGLDSETLRSISKDQFEEVQVHLNMDVSISPITNGM